MTDPLPPWDELKRGIGCPLCPERRTIDNRLLVRKLRLCTLYLAEGRTYHGACTLIVDVRHVNYTSELSWEEWSLIAQDLRDSERAVLRAFAPDHVNVESLGNTVPHMHWGLYPRYKDDGRWGQPIWTTRRSEMKWEPLSEAECADYVRRVNEALDAPDAGRSSYQPWRPDQFPRLGREIAGAVWHPNGDLEIEVAEADARAPSLAITFASTRAYQGVDEGLRLRDSPDWSQVRALIYRSRNSPYLLRFRENAAGTMDNFGLTHWLVASCNECVDVITECEPVVVSVGAEHGVPNG
jgi:diadenosine tetraphosphate (Ap4A) HIT family hydrolase